MHNPGEWAPLRKGDKIYIVAPGAKLEENPSDDHFTKSHDALKAICELIKSWGLVPIFSSKIFGYGPEYYHYAASHEDRIADFIAALQSDAAAIWCFRGGYGSNRIVEALIERRVNAPNQPKAFIGFSDMCNLHTFLQKAWGWQTIHGPVATQAAKKSVRPEDIASLRAMLFGEQVESTLELEVLPSPYMTQLFEIKGSVVGGNLTTIQSALYTDWELPLQDRIVLFEEIGEAYYRIDRCLAQFLGIMRLHKPAAVIFGNLFYNDTTRTEKEVQSAMFAVMQEFSRKSPCPVFYCSEIGHGMANKPIGLNTFANIDFIMKPKLTIHSGFDTALAVAQQAAAIPVANVFTSTVPTIK